VLGVFGEYEWSSIELTYQDTNTPEQKFRLRDAPAAPGGLSLTPTSLLYLSTGYTWARATAIILRHHKRRCDVSGQDLVDFVGRSFASAWKRTGHRLTLRGGALRCSVKSHQP
jgi:hypothetical protein